MKGFQRSVVRFFFAVTIALVVAFMAATPLASAGTEENETVLAGARIYPSQETPAILNGVVVVRGGKIAAVGERGDVAIPHAAKILDCTGLVTTAGFQNSQVHFTESKWNNAGTQPAPRLSAQLVTMFAIYGFTIVVDTGSILENTTKLRSSLESGEVAGPRIITPVASLFPPDGLPIYLRKFRELFPFWTPHEPATPEAAVNIVRPNVGESQDILELFIGSFVTYENIKPMPLDVARAAATEAHREGRLVFAHPSNMEGVKIALDAGVDVLAHTASAAEAWSPDLIAEIRKHKISVVPTLKLWKYVFQGAPDPKLGEQVSQNCIGQLQDLAWARGREDGSPLYARVDASGIEEKKVE